MAGAGRAVGSLSVARRRKSTLPAHHRVRAGVVARRGVRATHRRHRVRQAGQGPPRAPHTHSRGAACASGARAARTRRAAKRRR
eukprot:940055-Prymnesium_polylepis.1